MHGLATGLERAPYTAAQGRNREKRAFGGMLCLPLFHKRRVPNPSVAPTGPAGARVYRDKSSEKRPRS